MMLSVLTLAIPGLLHAEDALDGGQVYDCVVEPSLQLKLAAPVSGVLKDVLVQRGDRIRKGQALARLHSEVEEADAELTLAKARNGATVSARQQRVDFLKKKFERLAALAAKGAGTNAESDEAETEYKFANQELLQAVLEQQVAELEYKRSIALLEQRRLSSPIDGTVVERHLGAGEYAYEQAPILTVAQLDPLYVEVFLPAEMAGKVRLGSIGRVTPELGERSVQDAKVTVIDQVLDARSNTFGVRLEMQNSALKLPAGIRCRVEFGL